jgi:hypothetical protein
MKPIELNPLKVTISSTKPRQNAHVTKFVHYDLVGALYGVRADGTKELLQEEVTLRMEFNE